MDTWAVFFERQTGPIEEGPDRADRSRDSDLARKPRLNLHDGDVGLGLDEPEPVVAMRVDLLALRLALPAGVPLAIEGSARPDDSRRNPDPEPLRRLTGRRASIDHPVP